MIGAHMNEPDLCPRCDEPIKNDDRKDPDDPCQSCRELAADRAYDSWKDRQWSDS